MNQDKRKKTRIQGGWATGPVSTCSTRSDDFRMKKNQPPAWLGKVVDNPRPKPKEFVYVDHHQAKDTKQKPKERLISKQGVYNLSDGPTDVSRVKLFPTFIDEAEADWMYEQLYHELPWRQRSDVRKGISYVQPRLTVWYGDHPYSYSGVTLKPSSEWHPVLIMLRDRLEEMTGCIFNSMLGNLYRDGHDSVDWHADDEQSLGSKPTIASLSFGDIRNFELRKNPPPEANGDFTYMDHVKIPLTHGSLLIMESALQEDWQHRIPKEYHDRKPRINLTFRMIYPE